LEFDGTIKSAAIDPLIRAPSTSVTTKVEEKEVSIDQNMVSATGPNGEIIAVGIEKSEMTGFNVGDTQNVTSTTGSNGENIEMGVDKTEMAGFYVGDEESERNEALDGSGSDVQSSYCTARKKIMYGTVICFIIAAAAAIPCVLIFGGFLEDNSNSFPVLSKAKANAVIASIPADICDESVPKSGDCTPNDSDTEKQGGELCNLVAKSMINTTISVDIALINANICKETLLAPDLTAGNIEDAIISENLIVVDIAGIDIVNILTEAISSTFGDLGYHEAYPYAAGLRYDVEANLPPSERVKNIEVNRGLRVDGWEPIDTRKYYKVVTTESLASGGMGYVSFENAFDEWKMPLNITSGDAFYAMAKSADDSEWSVLPSSEYSTQLFVGEADEPAIATVPNRICHALIPGQPISSLCTAEDVVRGGEVCNFVSWAIYDQNNFLVDMVILKGDSCAGDMEDGDFVESTFDTILSENQSLVTIDLLGSEIMSVVEQMVSSAIGNGVGGNYPYAAGLRFNVLTNSSPMVSNVQILTSSGDWVEIQGAETYRIATTADNAFSSSAQDTSMGTTMKQEIFKYAEEWKALYKPSREKTSTHVYA